jgi:hypothetical protein
MCKPWKVALALDARVLSAAEALVVTAMADGRSATAGANGASAYLHGVGCRGCYMPANMKSFNLEGGHPVALSRRARHLRITDSLELLVQEHLPGLSSGR